MLTMSLAKHINTVEQYCVLDLSTALRASWSIQQFLAFENAKRLLDSLSACSLSIFVNAQMRHMEKTIVSTNLRYRFFSNCWHKIRNKSSLIVRMRLVATRGNSRLCCGRELGS